MILLNENLFETYEDETLNNWVEVDSKSVPDSDGFMTDYTWYTNGKKHIFMFGDKDLYEPDESYSDWEVEIYPGNEQNAQNEAQEWFDNYHGFEDEDEEELNESIIIEDEDDITHIINYLFGGKPLPKHISEEDAETFNESQAADYVYYREWEGDNRIIPEAVKALEDSYTERFGDNDDKDEILEEDFSPTLPKWLINYLNNNNKIKQQLSNNKHLDLANMQYIKVPKDEMPANGFHPLFKDNNKQFVYLLRDNRRNVVYLPGINDNNTSLYVDPDDDYKSTNISYISKKKLLDYAVQLGYIETTNEANRNSTKQEERKYSRKGSLERGQGQYYSTSGWGRGWVVPNGQDKSGYLIDKDKYKNMLDQADMETYSRQYVRYTKKLDVLRNAIIEYMSNMPLNKSIGGGWGSGIQYAIRYFEDAIYSFEKLQENIEKILTNEDLTDEEKNQWIQEEFDGNKSFNSVTDLRKNIEKSWEELSNFKDKFLKRMDESIESDNGKGEEDPMAKLAKKHNLDILTPMNVEPGSMRVSGTVRDLDNFYREAEETGLLKIEESQKKIFNESLNETKHLIAEWVKEKFESGSHIMEEDEFKEALKDSGKRFSSSLYDYYIELCDYGPAGFYEEFYDEFSNWDPDFVSEYSDDEEDLDEKLTMKDFPEFREIAKEVGLITAGDLERFRKEEMQPGESELDAIKRYRDELVASGVDLSMLKNESLINEGAMSELDLDIQNGATFSSILKDELVPLKKKLYQLEDSETKDIEEIEKVKKEISKVEAKLLILSKK